jgi:hypothetical protein
VGKKKNRYYIITGEKSKMLYGAFPFTEDGKKKAKKYIKNMKSSEQLLIVEK